MAKRSAAMLTEDMPAPSYAGLGHATQPSVRPAARSASAYATRVAPRPIKFQGHAGIAVTPNPCENGKGRQVMTGGGAMLTTRPKPIGGTHRLRPRVWMAAATSDAPPAVSQATVPWATLPRGLVDGGEIVLLAIKPSPWKPVLDSASWLVTSCLLAVALAFLNARLPGLSILATIQVVLLVGVTRLGIALVRWAPTWHVLTNRRVIDVCGVRTPRISASMLLNIRNTYCAVSPVERIARIGTITFVTDQPDDPPRHWASISSPQEVHVKIRRAIEGAIDQCGFGA